jgi:hypothetical protein
MLAAPEHSANIDLFHIGTRVTSHRRGNCVGIIKTEPFHDALNGDRRWWVWVDYTDSNGSVAIDPIRELRPVHPSTPCQLTTGAAGVVG